MNAEAEHHKRVQATLTYFQVRGIRCEDFEKRAGPDPAKRPDLLLPDFPTVIEVKTFAPQEQEIKEAQRIGGKELAGGKVSAYWHPTFYDRFGDHLRACANRRVAYVSTGATKVVGSPGELLALGWQFPIGAASKSRFPGAHQRDPSDVLTLPSREWIGVDLSGKLLKEAAARSVDFASIELRAEHHDGRPFKQEIHTTRQP